MVRGTLTPPWDWEGLSSSGIKLVLNEPKEVLPWVCSGSPSL